MNNKLKVEQIKIADLKPHPRNYKEHPEDQIAHIVASIKAHGFYRNIIIARDSTILAGHASVAAAKSINIEKVPCVRLDLDPLDKLALQVLAGDNEISKLSVVDDRQLTSMLKELSDFDTSLLLGTGFDSKMLAALTFTTRPASEIRDNNAAAHWVGAPDYSVGVDPLRVVISFVNKEDRERFVKEHDLKIDKVAGMTWSTRWPFTEREDAASIRFEEAPK